MTFTATTIICDGTTKCDGCGKRPGTASREENMTQFHVGLCLYFACHKCSPAIQFLIQTGKLT